MQSAELKQTIVKTIRFDLELENKIQKLAEEAERDFSQQVRFMLKKYLQITEK